jgi:hypothetical protein
VRARGDRGAIAVLAALMLVVVGAFMALAVNVGLIMQAKGQLQNAADAAALAAAGSLDGTTAGLATARQMAARYTQPHQVTGEAVTIDPDMDVRFGRWDFVNQSFGEITDLSRVFEIDAVRVVNGRDQSGTHNSPLQVFFSGWLGKQSVDIGTHAVAVGRGGRTDNCPMPFVLPSCLPCNTTTRLVMSNDWQDNVGFINLTGANGNDAIATNILDRCSQTAVAKDYTAQNGNDLNTKLVQALLGLDKFDNVVAPLTAGPNLGQSGLCVFLRQGDAFPIMSSNACPSPKFTGTVTVAQFAVVEILAVTDNGTEYTTCPTAEQWGQTGKDFGTPIADKDRSLTVRLKCNGNDGLTFNSAVTLRLVQ